MSFWLIAVIIGPVVFLIVFLSLIVSYSIKNSEARNNQEEINAKIGDILNEKNFTVTRKFLLRDSATVDKEERFIKQILVDNKSKKLCLIDYERHKSVIIPFKDFLDYQIYENSGTETTGGGVYGYWTNVFGAATSGVSKELKLILKIKKYDISSISYVIVSNTLLNSGLNKSSNQYKKCLDDLQEVTSFLEVIKDANQSKEKKED